MLAKSRVVLLKLPPLPVVVVIAHLHLQLVLLLTQGHALPTHRVVQSLPLVAVLPVLVPPSPMAGEQDHVLGCKVKARLITSYFPLLGQHPVLISTL